MTPTTHQLAQEAAACIFTAQLEAPGGRSFIEVAAPIILTALQARDAEHEKELATLRQQLDERTEELKRVRVEWLASEGQWLGREREWAGRTVNNERELSALQQGLSKKEEERDALIEKCTNMQRERDMMLETLNNHTADFERANFRVTSLERQLAGLEWTDAAKQLLIDNAALKSSLATAERERDEARQVIADLKLGPDGWKPISKELKDHLRDMSEQACERASKKGNLER
jgi:chromosome segregation ATPase